MSIRLTGLMFAVSIARCADAEAMPAPPLPSCPCERMREELARPLGEVAFECQPRDGLRIAAGACDGGPVGFASLLGSETMEWRGWAADKLLTWNDRKEAAAAVARWLADTPEVPGTGRAEAMRLLQRLNHPPPAVGNDDPPTCRPVRDSRMHYRTQPFFITCGYSRGAPGLPPLFPLPTLLGFPALGLLGALVTSFCASRRAPPPALPRLGAR